MDGFVQKIELVESGSAKAGDAKFGLPPISKAFFQPYGTFFCSICRSQHEIQPSPQQLIRSSPNESQRR